MEKKRKIIEWIISYVVMMRTSSFATKDKKSSFHCIINQIKAISTNVIGNVNREKRIVWTIRMSGRKRSTLASFALLLYCSLFLLAIKKSNHPTLVLESKSPLSSFSFPFFSLQKSTCLLFRGEKNVFSTRFIN